MVLLVGCYYKDPTAFRTTKSITLINGLPIHQKEDLTVIKGQDIVQNNMQKLYTFYIAK